MADRQPTSPYLRPWSIIDDDEIRLLRDLRVQVATMVKNHKGDPNMDLMNVSMVLDRLEGYYYRRRTGQ